MAVGKGPISMLPQRRGHSLYDMLIAADGFLSSVDLTKL
jgi:hypothetical protein